MIESGVDVVNVWPLVGRSGEIAIADAAVDSCLAGTGSIVHVEAVAGSGKTFLLDHIIERSSHRLQVVQVTLRDGTPVPYGVPLGLLGLTPRELGLAEHGPRSFLEAGVGNATDALVVETLLERFEVAMSASPTMLVVDDLHLADPGSMLWLAAAAAIEPLPFVLLTAARPPVADTPFARAYHGYTAGSTLIRLGPLTASDLDQLLEFRFDRSAGPRLRDSLAAVGGSPLVLTAMLEALTDDDIVTVDGSVDVDEETADRMRTVVPTAVASRVGAVAGGDATTIAAMALSGSVFELDDVAAVLGVPLAAVIAVCERIKQAGLVVSDGTHRFRHEHYRLAAGALVDAPTQRAIHAALARHLIARRADPLHVADHLIRAEASGDEASEWLRRGAEQLVQLDPTAALELIERAEAVAPSPDRRRTMLKARALANVGRAAESEALVHHLLVGATPDEEAALRRDLAMVKFQQGLVGETSAELVRAAELASDVRSRTRLVAETSFAHLFVADFATARTVAKEAASEGERVGDIGAVIAAEMVGGLVALYDHDLDEAVRLATRLEAFSELPEAADAALYQPWFSAALIRITLGEYAHARRLDGVGRRRSQRAGYMWMVPAYDALDAYVAFNLGELDDAEAIATSAIGWGIEDSFGATLWCHGFRALIAAARGDWERVRTSITAAEALVLPGQAQFGWTHLALAQTALAEHDGHPEAGYEALCATWDVYEAFGIDSPRQELGPAMARLAHGAGDRERLDLIVQFMQGSAERTRHPLWVAEATEVTAWRDGDDVAMCQASEMFEAAGRMLRAGEVMGFAAEIAALAGGSTARWYARRAREQLEAVGATALVERVAELGGGASAVRSAGATAGGVESLSRSERAVVALVAEGLTNTQIAERLFLSRRTVESHVSAAYRKLQLSNRVELARVVLDG